MMEKFDKFYKKSIKERHEIIKALYGIDVLNNITNPISIEQADKIVENAVGIASLPLGLLTNLRMNGNDYVIPMAIEEPSVIAAANKACKLALPNGFSAEALGNDMVGMIQLKVENADKSIEKINEHKREINEMGRELTKELEKYGGHWEGFFTEKLICSRGEFVIFKFLVNTADAMGANIINSTAEALAPELEKTANGKAILRILSNYAIYRKIKANAVFNLNEEEKQAFLDAFELAKHDIFRLVTNNKGFMNGADAVAIAFGQDFRALEACLHSYSIKNMLPLVDFVEHEKGIKANAEIPIAVGIKGGLVNILNHSKASMEITKPKSANELAMIIACVGIANNFAATLALATSGIQKGHMKLHARTIALSLGASSDEIEKIYKLIESGSIKPKKDDIKSAIEKMRTEKKGAGKKD